MISNSLSPKNTVEGIAVDAERLAAYREQDKCREGKETETRPGVAHPGRRGEERTSFVLLV
jgi:hypothetical protein